METDAARSSATLLTAREIKGAYDVLIPPGLIEFTRIPFGPSSHAMLRAIWSTADLDVLYDILT